MMSESVGGGGEDDVFCILKEIVKITIPILIF